MVIILDFGSQFTQLIARRIREAHVYCEILPHHVSAEVIRQHNPQGLILSGGPNSVTSEEALSIDPAIFQCGLPILGICYGMQLIVQHFGGQVVNAAVSEFGHTPIVIKDDHVLLKDLQTESDRIMWMSHGDRVDNLSQDFSVIASTQHCPIAAIANDQRKLYALQFHPETTHSVFGYKILQRFVYDICGCEAKWTIDSFHQDSIQKIKQEVGTDRVLLGLSGGVDSSVLAALLHEAIADQLVCVFVDTGLLRLGEREQVEQTFAKHLGIHLITVDARERFFKALAGVTDPERKRKICGHLFIDCFAEQAQKLGAITWLAQGTIYPDVIESAATATSQSKAVKTHHNVGGLPERLPFKLLEPLAELFKDEVRELGLQLNLPTALIYRHPFPGPGLTVRILGEVTMENVKILQQADAIFMDALHEANLYHHLGQAFCVFLPIQTVGVKGDARCYEHVIVLRAVETSDYMTAKWARLPQELIAKISRQITNEVPNIARVVYDVTSKPPATIEWE